MSTVREKILLAAVSLGDPVDVCALVERRRPRGPHAGAGAEATMRERGREEGKRETLLFSFFLFLLACFPLLLFKPCKRRCLLSL